MKRKVLFTLVLVVSMLMLLTAPLSAALAQAEDVQPRIYLTNVPSYGSTSDVEGTVACENGEAFDTEQYRVTLFLQTSSGGQYWVKPTFAEPSVGLYEDGTFSIDYTTGGVDEEAVALHVLLIPADYTPSEYHATLANALGYVSIVRSKDGENRVAPSTALDPVPVPKPVAAGTEAKDKAVAALSDALAQNRESLYVYREFGDTWNHFSQKAKIAGTDMTLIKDMNENWTENPYAGRSCIRCEIGTRGADWGGWMFLNGYLPKGETVPHLNDGEQEDAGLDLTGADTLRFFAKGEKGGERVEFFTAGFGYDGEKGTKLVQYPDSAKKRTLGFITLTKDWQEYAIDLTGADMSYICCGFGYVCSGNESGSAANVFYLDDIRFTGKIAMQYIVPMLLRSYDTENVYIQNAAFSYDNALVAMALLSEFRQEEAATILDAFVYAIDNDRYMPGRVRNAYCAGDIASAPGWESGARLPGWYDAKAGAWYEDRYQVGSNVGNTAYVALALLQYDAAYGQKMYLDAAATLMDWVLEHCADERDGFTAGYDGWPEGSASTLYPLTYKSVEHNIDAYAAFKQLYARTGDERYNKASASALAFIKSMYDKDEGVFYTGTLNDGVTLNRSNIVLDAQVWAALALGDEFAPYEASLNRVAKMRTSAGGYPFCESNAGGGFWAEGTAYTALMYRLRGEDALADGAMDALSGIQLDNGLFPAATVDALPTGFELFNGMPWTYSREAHIAPAAWFIMACNGFNPYTFA